MNAPALIPADTLPVLIDRAARALASARTSGEVLEARDMARTAYDAAKSAGRMMRAKAAHDEVIAAVYRAQADAAVIEARAKIRLADEYDDAQARGEVKRPNNEKTTFGAEAVSAGDIGLSHKDVHEARRLRDAEATEPGLIERAVNQMVERGEEPTRAALQRSVMEVVKAGNRAPSNRNPLHRADAKRDAVICFTGDCRRVAEAADLEALAAFSGHPVFRQQMLDQAHAAAATLARFLHIVGETDA